MCPKRKRTEDDDDDEANASDVVSRDRRPSSSATKAQHREATHKYIYIYTPGRAVLMRLSFFLLSSLVIAVLASFSLPSLPSLSPSRPLLPSLHSSFFFHATHNTARDPLRRHAVATGISELAEQTSADKSTGGIQYIWK